VRPTANAPVSTAASPRLETSTCGGYGSHSRKSFRTGSSTRSPFTPNPRRGVACPSEGTRSRPAAAAHESYARAVAPPTAHPYRWTILAAGVFGQASFSAIFFGLAAIAPAIRHDYSLTLPQVGVVLAALNFGLVATLLLWGIVADRIGERAVLATGLVGCAVALVAAGLTSSFASLVVTLALAGALGGGTQSASGRAVMGWFGAEERGLALGIRQTAVPAGGAIASGVLPVLISHVSLRAAFFALAGWCVAGAIVGGLLLRAEPPGDHGELGKPLRDPRVWRLCFASTFYVATQVSLVAFLVLFLHDDRGVSLGAAAGLLAGIQVLGGAARIVAGRWSDRIGARIVPLRLLGLALAVTVGAAASLAHAPLWVLVPALVVAGTFALSWNGLSFTAAAEAAGRARSGAAIGLQQTFLSAGSIVAPIVFAAVVHHSSWRLGFSLAAASPLAGYALLSPLAERRS
jgi:sugar phosphate permease